MLPHLPVPKNLYTRSGWPTSSAKPKEARNCNIVNADLQELRTRMLAMLRGLVPKSVKALAAVLGILPPECTAKHPCNGHYSTREILNAIFPSSCDLGERAGECSQHACGCMGRYPKQQGRCETFAQPARTDSPGPDFWSLCTFSAMLKAETCSRNPD